MLPSVYFLGAGFLLGLGHALDADHLAAVAALTSGERGWRRCFLLGVRWGAGHAAVLLAAGCAALLLRWPMSPRLVARAELAVGAMLVLLGARVLWQLWRERVHIHPHRHGDLLHVHFHSHRRGPGHQHAHGWQPVLVGAVHGLAGSAGLMLLVAAATPSAGQGLAYVLAFGVGAALAMGVLSVALRLPLALAEGRSAAWGWLARGATGLASVALGVLLMVSPGGV